MEWYETVALCLVGATGLFLAVNMLIQTIICELFIILEQRKQDDEMDRRIRAIEMGADIDNIWPPRRVK